MSQRIYLRQTVTYTVRRTFEVVVTEIPEGAPRRLRDTKRHVQEALGTLGDVVAVVETPVEEVEAS